MAVTYKIDSSRKLIYTTCTNPLTSAEVILHFRTLKEDPACTGHLDVLLDLSETDSLPENNQLAAVGAEIADLRAKVQFGRCAIVATRDAMFGMMRVFEVITSQYFRSIRVFRDRKEADVWLASPHTGDADS